MARNRKPIFPSRRPIAVVLPVQRAGLGEEERVRLRGLPELLTHHRAQVEGFLGAPVQPMTFDPGKGPRWLVGPAHLNPAIDQPASSPVIRVDRRRQLLITDAPDVDGLFDALSFLASTTALPDGEHPALPADDLPAALDRLEEEVGETWAGFATRGHDWSARCQRYRRLALQADDPIPVLRAWLAGLGDAHTWVRASSLWGSLPYQAWVQGDAAVLVHVPADSAGFRAGAREGHRLRADARSWWEQTAAPGHARPLIAGLRMLSGPVGERRVIEARGPGARRISWEERIPPPPWSRLVEWRRLPSGAGYLAVRRFLPGDLLPSLVDEALAELRGAPGLIVDLRGNGGGDPYQAARFRSRFLHGPTRVGSIRYRLPGGPLSEPFPIHGEPAPAERRWQGPVRFLTDALTHSSAEDALLGLQGLPHVQVIGEPSGGGSRQVRKLPLLPGWRLWISTALTYDRAHRCVEGAGIPVDKLVRPRRPSLRTEEDPVMAAADSGW